MLTVKKRGGRRSDGTRSILRLEQRLRRHLTTELQCERCKRITDYHKSRKILLVKPIFHEFRLDIRSPMSSVNLEIRI